MGVAGQGGRTHGFVAPGGKRRSSASPTFPTSHQPYLWTTRRCCVQYMYSTYYTIRRIMPAVVLQRDVNLALGQVQESSDTGFVNWLWAESVGRAPRSIYESEEAIWRFVNPQA
jgi:hypothetical protein